MNKRIFRRVLALVMLAGIALGSFTACAEDDGSGYIFKYDIVGNPRTLDPQTATDSSAMLVIANIFEGLLKLDTDGVVTAGVAGEYEIADGGLEYTFYLREDIYWTDGADFEAVCTAHDFVYAFRRLFSPQTKSGNAEAFYCIKNAEKVHKGRIKDVEEIGVEAVSDYVLKITLDYPNPLFASLLTTAPAMPCNEEFYIKTEGRYGLGAESIPSNGAFYVSKWSYDDYSTLNNNLILRRNAKNSEADRVYPYGLNFFIDEADSIQNFYDGTNHSLVLSGEDALMLMEKGYSHDDYENAVWGIMFNTESVFGNADLRLALATAFSKADIPLDKPGYRAADFLIPDIVIFGTEKYRDLFTGKISLKTDTEKARALFESGAEAAGYGKLNGLSLIMPFNPELEEHISYVSQKWQAELGFYCNITQMTTTSYSNALRDGDYDLALVKLTGSYNSPSAFLSQFTGSTQNASRYKNAEYEALIYQAERAEDTESGAAFYSKAEALLLSEAVFIPLCYQTEYFIYNNNSEGIVYNAFTGTLTYREAKYFKS